MNDSEIEKKDIGNLIKKQFRNHQIKLGLSHYHTSYCVFYYI